MWLYQKTSRLPSFSTRQVPEEATTVCFDADVLYCRPKASTPADETTHPWYEAAPVGKNKLSRMVSEMCEDAGIPRRTNHSLHATGVTALFQSSVPEKIIQKTTGHHSFKALRMYEHMSDKQHQALSKVMMSTNKVTYDKVFKENEVVTCVHVKENNGGKLSVPSSSSSSSRCVERIFGDLTNCTIGHITINLAPQFSTHSTKIEEEFDSLAKFVNVNIQ